MVDAPVTPELAELEATPARRARPGLGYGMVLAAATLWGANGVLAKVLIESGLSTYRLAELRSAGAALLFVGAVALTRPGSLRLSRREVPFMLAFGILGLAFVQFFYLVGITRLDVGIALVIQYLAPVWVALWARFFVHEQVKQRLWYGLALALAGLVTVTELWHGGALDGIGVLASLVASVAYAGYILLAELGLQRGRDVMSLLAFGFVFATLFWTIVQPWWSLPAGLLDDEVSLLGRLAETDAPMWALLLGMVIFGTFVPFLLMIGALHHLPAIRVTVIAMLEPVIAAVVAYAWLEEALGPAQVIGGLLVLAGVGLAQTARTAR